MNNQFEVFLMLWFSHTFEAVFVLSRRTRLKIPFLHFFQFVWGPMLLDYFLTQILLRLGPVQKCLALLNFLVRNNLPKTLQVAFLDLIEVQKTVRWCIFMQNSA